MKIVELEKKQEEGVNPAPNPPRGGRDRLLLLLPRHMAASSLSKGGKKHRGLGIFLYICCDYTFYPDDQVQNGVRQGVKLGLVPERRGKMKTFLIFGKSSPQELKEISVKYRAEVVSLVNDFGGNVRSMYAMLRERYLVLIFAFPGIKTAMRASIALSKLTGISFTTLPAVPIDEFNNIII